MSDAIKHEGFTNEIKIATLPKQVSIFYANNDRNNFFALPSYLENLGHNSVFFSGLLGIAIEFTHSFDVELALYTTGHQIYGPKKKKKG